MNLTSAGVLCTFERSAALAAVISWLDWPGAPGCTIGGWPAVDVVRHAAAAAISRNAAIRGGIGLVLQRIHGSCAAVKSGAFSLRDRRVAWIECTAEAHVRPSFCC